MYAEAMAAVSEVPEAPSSSGSKSRGDQADLPPGLRKYRRLEAPTAEQIASVSMFSEHRELEDACASL